MWATCVVHGGTLTVSAHTGRERASWAVDPSIDAVLLAEYLVGTSWAKAHPEHGRLVVFDCVSLGGDNLTGLPLRRRRELAAETVRALAHPDVRLVEQYPASRWRELWAALVERDGFEGLVFKSSAARYGRPWGRMKRVADGDYVCTGVHRDAAGRAVSFGYGLYVDGALRVVGSVRNGVAYVEVCEAERLPGRYLGRVMRITGQSVGASGAMRHPVFAGWRWDKRACECRA